MLKRAYEGQICSIARALEVVGDRWTLLIVRDLVLGLSRFDQLLGSLGIASNVLTDRLNRLTSQGIVDRVLYNERPERYEYQLTDKGRELGLVLLALMHWGDEFISKKPPRRARRRSDGAPVTVALVGPDGTLVDRDDVELVPGPGARSTQVRRPRQPSRR